VNKENATYNRDLDIAIKNLHKHARSIVLVKNSQVLYSSDSTGLAPLVHAIRTLGDSTIGAALADKTSGRAAALLSAYARIGTAYAETISEGAIEAFTSFGIPYKYNRRVPMILNKSRDAQCPFEKVISGSQNPKDAFLRLVRATGSRSTSGKHR
jgi:hypothetical protein